MSSLFEKMEKEGISDYRRITDIVGLRVTLQTLDDILKFKKAYLNAFNDSVGEIRCYGVCGPAVGSSDPRAKMTGIGSMSMELRSRAFGPASAPLQITEVK